MHVLYYEINNNTLNRIWPIFSRCFLKYKPYSRPGQLNFYLHTAQKIIQHSLQVYWVNKRLRGKALVLDSRNFWQLRKSDFQVCIGRNIVGHASFQVGSIGHHIKITGSGQAEKNGFGFAGFLAY